MKTNSMISEELSLVLGGERFGNAKPRRGRFVQRALSAVSTPDAVFQITFR
jgi:hypothetical protein